MKKVDVIQEWVWYCPECKSRNCTEPEVAELSAYEKQELWEDHGLMNCQTGDFILPPPFVTCCECNETFETIG
jgi:hypothetical protein